jgi:hypothetical protein
MLRIDSGKQCLRDLFPMLELWVKFDELKAETRPVEGSQVLVQLTSGVGGPANYDSSGFVLFNAPSREIGKVERWRYWKGF